MANTTQRPDGRWRRFARGMLVSLLIVMAWSAICWHLYRGYGDSFWPGVIETSVFNVYILVMLAYLVICLLLARWKTLWWSGGAVCGTLLGVAGPVALALIAASGMPAMRY